MASGSHASRRALTVKAKEADGECGVGADNRRHDREAEDASGDPREQIGVLVDLEVDRGRQSHAACLTDVLLPVQILPLPTFLALLALPWAYS